MREIVYVVLAAGETARPGLAAVFEPFEGRSPLARVAAALGERETLVVVPPDRIDDAVGAAPLALTIANDQPGRGLSYSVKVALAAIPPDRNFAILLADMPHVTGELLARVEECFGDEADVAFPADSAGAAGYPIVFAARARRTLEALPDGDTLGLARDSSALSRVVVTCDDPAAFTAYPDA